MMIDKPGSSSVRNKTVAAHRKYMADHLDGMRLGGPLLDDDGENMIGSLIVKAFPDRAAVEEFLRHEPYNQAGLFELVIIRPFNALIDTGGTIKE